MRRTAAIALVLVTAAAAGAQAPDPAAAQRGEYIFQVAGCASCHTSQEGQQRGPLGAGGRSLRTPFGTFYGPNITSDRTHGIGRWSEADFLRALREGVAPDGSHYFPVFPYTRFTLMTDTDMRDLFAYVRTIPAQTQPSRAHDVGFPFNLRFLQFFWKLLYFNRGPYQPNAAQSAQVNRGAYLSEAMSHCQECHTPRNFLGALRNSMAYAGHRDGPGTGAQGGRVPNITPEQTTGLGAWSGGDLEEFLRSGMTPDGDSAGGDMGVVIAESTSKLTADDLRAMVTYIRALPPIVNDLRRPSG